MQIGRLRDAITIEQRVEVRNAANDLVRVDWVTVPGCEYVPAKITPVSARDIRSGNAKQAEVSAEIVIRWQSGLSGTMRARELVSGAVYDIGAPIPDNRSGREWITFNGSLGLTDGSAQP